MKNSHSKDRVIISNPNILPFFFISIFVFLSFSLANAQKPWLHTEGNQIMDEAGNAVTLRGVSVLAPEHNNECTTCSSKPISEMISLQADAQLGWYSRVVRLMVTTARYKEIKNSFKTIIDPYVQQAVSKGLYIIVDLHLVSDFDYNGSGGVSQSKVMNFWSYLANKYANTPNVIFEVYNEPMSPNCWSCWKEYIQPVIDTIRSVAPNNLILVGSPGWSTQVNQAAADPLAGNNLVYVYHIYPNQGQATTNNLDSDFGTAAQTIPVMISEFGWNQDPNYSDVITQGATTNWGGPFRQYMDAHPNISWSNFIFDNFWKPQYFDQNWNLLSGENQGRFMQQWFEEMKDDHQPQPAKLTANAVTSSQIDLTWPVTTGATSYNVKRSGSSGGPYSTIVPGLAGTTYSDIALNAETPYYYVVSAIISGNEGPNSSEASATTEATGIIPDVPILTSVSGGDSQVVIKWGSAIGATSYRVKRAEVSGGPYTTIVSGLTTRSYTDTTVTNGNIYYYVVSAISSNRESANSIEISDLTSSVVIINDDVDATTVGSWRSSAGTPGFYGTDYLHDSNTGSTGGKSVTFTPTLPSAGNYLVSIWWTAADNRASNVPIDVYYAGGKASFTINQQYNGSRWVVLGHLDFDAGSTGSVVIRNDGANGYVIADAVKFALNTGKFPNKPPTAEFTYSTNGLLANFDASGSWDGDGTITSYNWDFGDGTTGSGETVSHTYASSNSYTATLTVTDDSLTTDINIQTVSVDAESANTSTVILNQQQNGSVMNVIGTYYFDAGTLGAVKIRTDNTNGYVIADAVKFSKSGQSDIVMDNEDTTGITIVGDWTTNAKTSGAYGIDYIHDGNTGKGNKSVTFTPDLPVAGDWTVYIQWTSLSNRATNVPVDIIHSRGVVTATTTYAGINDKKELSLYPNPLKDGELVAEFGGQISGSTYLKVFNLNGVEIYRTKMTMQQVRIPKTKLTSGVFVVEIESNGQQISRNKLLVE